MNNEKQTHIVRLPQVCEMVGVSPATVWRWVSNDAMPSIPKFPSPFKLGPNSTAWDKAEILDWLDACKATRGIPAEVPA